MGYGMHGHQLYNGGLYAFFGEGSHHFFAVMSLSWIYPLPRMQSWQATQMFHVILVVTSLLEGG